MSVQLSSSPATLERFEPANPNFRRRRLPECAQNLMPRRAMPRAQFAGTLLFLLSAVRAELRGEIRTCSG